MADELERWLAVADNRGEWERLRRALAFEAGFGLFVVDVPDRGTEGRVVELLAGVDDALVVLDARASGEEAAVKKLLRRPMGTFVLRCVEACRSDVEALERCLVQLNARRDQIVARGHRLVIVLRRDVVARMQDVAPDLYSVHRARARFARLVQPRPTPLWLLTDEEFAAVLVDDARPFDVRVRDFEDSRAMIRGHRQLEGIDEAVAARLFARSEGLRCLVRPRTDDLGVALEFASPAGAELLRDSLRADSRCFAHLCAAALTWMKVQRSKLDDARVVLAEARALGSECGRFAGLRNVCLAGCIAAAEGTITPDDIAGAPFGLARFREFAASALATVGEIEWEYWTRTRAMGWVVELLDYPELFVWRLDSQLRLLPIELVDAAPSGGWADAVKWLYARRSARDRGWSRVWTEQMLLDRAGGRARHSAALIELANDWLAVDRPRIYDVWHPLVDVHAEQHDLETLDRLIHMPFAETAEARFGPELSAALFVAADILDRGLIELPNHERADLLARAGNRHNLPIELRLGWWSIELALTEPSSAQ